MLKRLRTLLSTTEGKLKALIVISGSAIALLVLMAGALAITSTPTFCSVCHEMSPEYYTWKASSHSSIPCVDCHIQPGVKNFVAHKIDSLKQVYYHFTGSYVQPIALNEDIPNSQCEECHDMNNRVTTPPGDIKFPHSTHLKQSLKCVDCHSGVAHGNIEEKGFTTLTSYDKWNANVGKAYIQAGFSKVSMQTCIDCHNDSGAPVTCETCHTKNVKPLGHTSLSWLTEHGKEAEQNVAACDKCHSTTSTFGDYRPDNLTVAEYARANTFCSNCHSQKPASHNDPKWRKTHAAIADKDKTGCLVCHDESGDPSVDNPSAKIECMKCHQMNHWMQKLEHPIPIPTSGYQLLCLQCHNKTACESCHAKATS